MEREKLRCSSGSTYGTGFMKESGGQTDERRAPTCVLEGLQRAVTFRGSDDPRFGDWMAFPFPFPFSFSMPPVTFRPFSRLFPRGPLPSFCSPLSAPLAPFAPKSGRFPTPSCFTLLDLLGTGSTFRAGGLAFRVSIFCRFVPPAADGDECGADVAERLLGLCVFSFAAFARRSACSSRNKRFEATERGASLGECVSLHWWRAGWLPRIAGPAVAVFS